MNTLQHLAAGFAIVVAPLNLLAATLGTLLGTLVGALPGLGPAQGVAILLPLALALKLPPETALILLAVLYLGCELGGRLSASLGAEPRETAGTPPAIWRGLEGLPLSSSAWPSFAAALVATLGIALLAPPLARWAQGFGPADSFALASLVFAGAIGLAGDAPLKAAVAATLGLTLSTVGLDASSGVHRFTGHQAYLSDGVPLLVVVVGVLSVSEIPLMLERRLEHRSASGAAVSGLCQLLVARWAVLRAPVRGFLVDVGPGPGPRLAGAADALEPSGPRDAPAREAARTLSAAGAFVPVLSLGVPGSAAMAVMVGALALHHIAAGPALFTEHPELAWSLIAALFVAPLPLLLCAHLPLLGAFAGLQRTPRWLLAPGLVAVGAVVVYSVHAAWFDLLLMAVIGLGSYLLRKQGVPMAPLILGFVLGHTMEQHLRHALSLSGGKLAVFWVSPTSKSLWLVAAALLTLPPLLRHWGSQTRGAGSAAPR
jgi:putative tricarboxylic transport membrane protein